MTHIHAEDLDPRTVDVVSVWGDPILGAGSWGVTSVHRAPEAQGQPGRRAPRVGGWRERPAWGRNQGAPRGAWSWAHISWGCRSSQCYPPVRVKHTSPVGWAVAWTTLCRGPAASLRCARQSWEPALPGSPCTLAPRWPLHRDRMLPLRPAGGRRLHAQLHPCSPGRRWVCVGNSNLHLPTRTGGCPWAGSGFGPPRTD